MQRTPVGDREKLIRLHREGVPVNTAARISGVPKTTAARIVAQSDAAADGPASARAGSSPVPYSGGPQPPANIPRAAYDSDQPRPPPPFAYDPRYHGHTFRSYAAPLSFAGFTLERVRAAIENHRQGLFLESSSLAIAILSFPPVLAALHQRIAPILALPRRILGGTSGLSLALANAVESQLAPRSGLLPPPYFPTTLWGATVFDLAFEGFAVWQHAYGPPDPITGVQMVYTRRWPTWAVQYYRYRRTFVAITSDGPVDILNDGKFTLVADSEEPHFLGAIVALGEEALDGKSNQRARASWIERYSNPKLVGEMPPGVAPRSPEGDLFFDALGTLRGPDGFGIIPNGAKLTWQGLVASQSTAIKDALDSNLMNVSLALLGQNGTTTSQGVYASPMFKDVARTVVDRDLNAIVRAANQGHVAPWLECNYAASIAAERAAGTWTEPVLEVPLPDPDADARIKSYGERLAALTKHLTEARAAGIVVDQPYVNRCAVQFEVEPPTLAAASATPIARLDLAPTDIAKVVRVDEGRASQGLPPVGDERGDMMIAEVGTTVAAEQAAGAAAGQPTRPDGAAQSTGSAQPDAPQGESAPTSAPDTAPADLATKMTAHGVERCEHGRPNRCTICGVERVRDFEPDPAGGPPRWIVKWRAIPRPGDPPPPPDEEPIDEPSSDPNAPVAAPDSSDSPPGTVPDSPT